MRLHGVHDSQFFKTCSPYLAVLFRREFDVEGDSQTCPDDSDYAQVYDGLASWSPIIDRYCGRVIPSAIKSTSNKLRIEFRSNSQYAGRGFDAVFTVESDKPGTLNCFVTLYTNLRSAF